MSWGTRSGIAGWFLVAACLPAEDRPARWGYIHAAIIEPSCATAGCHSALTAIAALNLSGNAGAYNLLTSRVCGEPPLAEEADGNYIVPFAADYSPLIYQLRGADSEGRPLRDVMPPDTPLPEVEVELVARWIDDGAQCD